MSGIYGILGISDTDRSFVNTIGQSVVYDAITQILQRHTADLAAARAVFVERQTEEFKIRYKSPGGGRMQMAGGLAPTGNVKRTGSWDVAFPIRDMRDALGGDDITLAYMTVQELDTHLDTIMIRHTNTVRNQLLSAILNNAQDTFTDPIHGDLAIEPLANGDAVVYPPVIGSESEATENHYVVSGYAATAIDDTHNPFEQIYDEQAEHANDVDVAVFIHPDERPEVEDLTDFVPVSDPKVADGSNADRAANVPTGLPGKVLGTCNNCWVVEWRWTPSGYMPWIDLMQPAPLLERVDPADTGIARGLVLVSRDVTYPLEASTYRDRLGFGAGNRLAGGVLKLTAGAYTVPTGY